MGLMLIKWDLVTEGVSFLSLTVVWWGFSCGSLGSLVVTVAL